MPYIGRARGVAVERLLRRKEELKTTHDATMRAIIEKEIQFLEDFLKGPLICNTDDY